MDQNRETIVIVDSDDESRSIGNNKSCHWCDLCGQSCVTLSALTAHIKHHFGLSFVNEVCERSFITVEQYEEHIHAHNPNDKSQSCYWCDLCGHTYPTLPDLTVHIKHHFGLTDSDALCENSFNTLGQYEEHRHVHNPKNSSMYSQFSHSASSSIHKQHHQCHICSKTFDLSAELQLHSIMHPQAKTLKCRFCDLPLTQQIFVMEHERHCVRNAYNQNMYICLLCDESFKRLDNLGKHIRTKHKCAEYWELYDNTTLLKLLLGKSTSDLSTQGIRESSTGKKNPNNTYSLCGHSFKRRYDLGKHIRKVHKCKYFKQIRDATSLCEAYASLNEVYAMKKSSSSHDIQKIKFSANECPLCHDSFTQEDILDEHICIDHKCEEYWIAYKAAISKTLPRDPASYLKESGNAQTVDKNSTGLKNPCNICSLCGESFTSRGVLGTHIRKIHNCMNYKQFLDTTSASGAFGMKKVMEKNILQHDSCEDTEVTKESHDCPLCNNRFTRHVDMNKHIFTTHCKEKDWKSLMTNCSDSENVQKKIFECPDCGIEKESRVGMIRHFYNNHYSKLDNQSKSQANQHSTHKLTKNQHKSLMDAVSFHCDLCGKKYRQVSDVVAHIKHHVKIPLHCETCDIIFTTRDDYKRHNLVQHGNKFSCKRCGDVFETVAELCSHRFSLHGKGSKKCCGISKLIPCDKCGKLFRKRNMWQHILHVHTENRKREHYICEFCGQSYLTYCNYFNHIREHKGLKRLKCSICSKIFMSEESLESHKLTHPDVPRPYKCRYCDATYTKHNHRKKHENVNHIRNYSKKCPDCGKRFLDSQKLKEHSVVHTKIKRFKCTICGMNFTQRSSLARHKKIHSEDKRHECTECGMKFVQKYSLTRHLLVHTGEKPHKCLQCPEAFRQVFMLTKHVRKHHSGGE